MHRMNGVAYTLNTAEFGEERQKNSMMAQTRDINAELHMHSREISIERETIGEYVRRRERGRGERESFYSVSAY